MFFIYYWDSIGSWWTCADLSFTFIKVQQLQIVLRVTQTLDVLSSWFFKKSRFCLMSGQACNLIKKTPTQMFPYEICKTFNITFIYRTLPVTFRHYLWKTNLKFRLISYRHMFSKIFGYLQKQQFLSVKLLYFLVYIISVIFFVVAFFF